MESLKEIAKKQINAKNANINDLLESVGTVNPLTSQNNAEQNDKSKESTQLIPVDKSSLYIIVGIIVIANIFTYSSFKFLNPTNRSQLELAILYVIIYVYTVLYSIAICYMSKWVVRLADVGGLVGIDTANNNIELIEKLIKNIFDIAIYTLPFHVLIGILSLAFQKHLMFDHNGDYLWSYQLFSCIISVIVAYMYNDKDISLDAEQIIRYYIIFVTVLSLIKLNVNMDSSYAINKFANGIVNLALNINLKKRLIIMPLIIMIIGIVMVTLGISISDGLKHMFKIQLGICIILAISINLMNRYSTVNVDTEKKLAQLPVLKAVSKWFIFMAVYLIPLYAYISVTKRELLGNFTTELMKTFDSYFQFILAAGTISLFILDKGFSVMDQKQITKLTSLMIIVALLLSKYRGRSM